MAEAIALAAKLGSVGFPTLLVLILLGSYYEVWVWGRQLRESETRSNERLRKVEADAAEWKQMSLQLAGLAESSVHLAREKP